MNVENDGVFKLHRMHTKLQYKWISIFPLPLQIELMRIKMVGLDMPCLLTILIGKLNRGNHGYDHNV